MLDAAARAYGRKGGRVILDLIGALKAEGHGLDDPGNAQLPCTCSPQSQIG
jgi:hypothetical protein